MAQYSASRAIRLPNLVLQFVCSRAILCFTAISIGITCRMFLPRPIYWYEILAACVLVLCWPRIELYVHYLMHHARGTKLYERHQLHHHDPLNDTAIGPLSTLLIYNVMPLPWYFLNMPILTTLVTVTLIAITIYEFIHYTTHFRYRPLTIWGQRVRRNHLLHHRDPAKYRAVVFPKAVVQGQLD